MAYELSDIKTALSTILGGVTGKGNIYTKERWTNDPKVFKTYFYHSGTKVINAWMITSRGYLPELRVSGITGKIHPILIIGVYSFKDTDNTEAAFDALVAGNCDAINSNFTYVNAWHRIIGEPAGARANITEPRFWAGHLIHYCEINVLLEVRA